LPRSGSGTDSTVAAPTTKELRPPAFAVRFRSATEVGGTTSRPRLLVGAPMASGVTLLFRYFSSVHDDGITPTASPSKPPFAKTALLETPTASVGLVTGVLQLASATRTEATA